MYINECTLASFKGCIFLEYQSLNDTESSAFVHTTFKFCMDLNLGLNFLDFLRT